MIDFREKSDDALNASWIGHVIELQIEQLRFIGVLSASSGHFEQESDHVRAVWEITSATIAAARRHNIEVPRQHARPVVYNPSNWHNEALCGYIGSDVSVSLPELITSYMELWLLSSKLSESYKNHFLKCALWFTQNHGADLRRGLVFLLDLFYSGFFPRVRLFTETLDSFVRFYALEADLTFLDGTTLKEKETINQELAAVVRMTAQSPLNLERYDQILGIVIDLVLDRVEVAYRAQSLDEWIFEQAALYGPLLYLGFVHAAADELKVGTTNRLLLSRFEEMAADLGATAGFRAVQADFHLPPEWSLDAKDKLATAYQERFPDGSWLDRMTEDRMVMPNAVRELVRHASTHTLGNVRLPREWRLPSERVIRPLCIAHGRHPAMLRSTDFPNDLLAAGVRAMDLPFTPESVVTVRAQLLAEDSSAIALEARDLAQTADPALAYETQLHLAQLREIYPWHPEVCHQSGKFAQTTGDFSSALTMLTYSVLMDPFSKQAWLSMSTLASVKQWSSEAAAFRDVSALPFLVDDR